ncbi:helix-turn-helix domain-containing protein [Sporomusa acidovorans]|uniref:HTH-type transcriptional regulator SinR n=1 Tax=Sporomusa acidovorans (strain ATCC 49682 / DSM 3132 / Mol) TaxID=1123286 RepID=A0ABZ3J728_SPOA4|nr:helix-turn-helix transcriptional regulator [Sporomusa acidovorans]OZC24195.1 HTH-type transcriptional regulator SinR [Sporomusa acidovorans DSM 3132]SDF77546.1 Helix-turn-helix [Sporomusa acidovorans]
MPSIGKILREKRKEKGYTQQELADKANLSRSYIADIEGERYTPSLNTIIKVARYLDLDLNFLQVIDGNTSSKNEGELD